MGNARQNENEVPGARGFRIIFSQFAYVYGVFERGKRLQSPLAVIGSFRHGLVGLKPQLVATHITVPFCQLDDFS